MSSRRILVTSFVLLFFAACTSPAPPPQHEVGSRLPELTIEDQHGVEHLIGDSVRLVLMSRDMDGGRIIREALAETGVEALESGRAVYVSDLSGMPGPIASMIAIPRMRERPYPVLLDRDGSLTASLPAEPGHATLLFLERRMIREVERVADVATIVEALAGVSER